MIVRDVMTTKLVTVTPGDTLSHAANLLRQNQFHHLPVVRAADTHRMWTASHTASPALLLFEGLLTAEDIDLAAATGSMSSSELLQRPWQERRVAEVMHRATLRVTPTTSLAAAAQILVERGLNALPVVEYTSVEGKETQAEQETQTVLVGLLTRSDLLIAMARVMGSYEPGMQLVIPLPEGNMAPLAQTLLFAAEVHIQVRSVIAGPMEGSVPRSAMLRIGTINPAPLLVRLQQAGIQYEFADPALEGDVRQ
jgi:acetoin utilization protein AcuB